MKGGYVSYSQYILRVDMGFYIGSEILGPTRVQSTPGPKYSQGGSWGIGLSNPETVFDVQGEGITYRPYPGPPNVPLSKRLVGVGG